MTNITTGKVGPFVSDNSVVNTQPVSSGVNALAGGFGATATGAASSVVGNEATDNGVANSTVLGQGASVTAGLTGSNVALGQGAVATVGALTGYAAFGTAGPQNSIGVVSVGSAGAERQITNVAAGSAPTDAVNVSQLTGAASNLGTTIANNFGGGAKYDSATGQVNAPSYTVNGNTYNNIGDALGGVSSAISTSSNKWITGSSVTLYAAPTAAGDFSTAVGSGSSSSAINSVAVGTGASATTANSVALGNASTTANAVATSDVTLQGNTYKFAGAAPVGVVSVGDVGAERQITNVAAGQINANSTDAVNGSQLYATNQAVNNIVGGGGIKYFHANSAAADSNAVGAESVAIGPQAVSQGAGSVAVGNGASATSSNGVALGAGSTADRAGMAGQTEKFSNVAVGSTQGAVSVGSAGGERQITNVAGGTQATDAVNVRQLESVKAGSVQYDTKSDGSVNYNSVTLGNNTGPTTIQNVAPGVAGTDAVNVDQLNSRANQLAADMRGNARDANAGTAGAMAMAGMPQAFIPGKSMFAAGVGGYSGQAALAVGVSKLSDNGRWIVKFSGSANSRGKVGVSAGAGFQW